MIDKDLINILAIILSPIIAVIIGQFLQMKEKKHEDKMAIFKTLMTSRLYGSWTLDAIFALNTIDVIFSDDEKVRTQWKSYYEKLCIQNPDEMEIKKIQDEKNKLLEIMAKSLGYKDKITWETIQNPYCPKGLINDIQRQQQYQIAQIELIEKISKMQISMENNKTKNDN